jgi:peptide deformylase
VTVLRVVEWPSEVLERKASEVTLFDEGFRRFVDDMHETMHASSGIGLAANQVGDLRRVFTVNIPFSEEADEERKGWHDKAFTFVNPVITKKEGKTRYQEGCLSFPGIYENVDRASEVWVKAVNEHGEPFEVHADGLFAICIQHELDHIDGIPFFKRMGRLKAAFVKKKMMRRALELKEGDVPEVEGDAKEE